MRRNVTMAISLVASVVGIAFLLWKPEPITTQEGSPPPETAEMPVSIATSPQRAPEIPGDPPVTEPHEGVVRGTVLQPDGQPAVGAIVRHTWEASRRQEVAPPNASEVHAALPTSVTTSGDGRFALSGLPRGLLTLSVTHETGRAAARAEISMRHPAEDLTVVLEAGLRLAGIVVAPDGKGIASAEVTPLERVRPLPRMGKGQPAFLNTSRAVRADESGHFVLGSMPPGDWLLNVSAEGFGATVTDEIPAGTENARILLRPGAALTCQVLRASDRMPLSEVTVKLRLKEGLGVSFRSESDERGEARFEDLGPSSYVLDLDDDTFALVTPPIELSIDPARKTDPVILLAEAGGEIRGRLLDGAANTGIPGMVLTATSAQVPGTRFSTPTDKDGNYRLGGLPAGEYSVRPPLRIPGYPQDPPEPLMKSVAVTIGRVADGVDFVLVPGAQLAGTVLDLSGSPVADALVRANTVDGPMRMGEFRTLADGRFSFGDYQEGEDVHLAAETPTARSGLMGPFVAGAPGSGDIELRLNMDCYGIIAGKVVDEKGAPFECYVMTLAEEAELQFPHFRPHGDTDGLGNFVLTGVCPGTYTLQLVPRSNVRQTVQRVRIAQGESLFGLTLVYNQGDLFEIAGLATDPDGVPIPGARITAQPASGEAFISGQSVSADTQGTFLFSDLPAGTYLIEGSAEGYPLSTSIKAETGTSDTVIELIPAPRLSGRVVGSAGHPITAYLLSLSSSDAPDSQPTTQNVSDPDGWFAFVPSFRGNWTLHVSALGYVDEVVDLGTIGYGDDLPDLEIVLRVADQVVGAQ